MRKKKFPIKTKQCVVETLTKEIISQFVISVGSTVVLSGNKLVSAATAAFLTVCSSRAARVCFIAEPSDRLDDDDDTNKDRQTRPTLTQPHRRFTPEK